MPVTFLTNEDKTIIDQNIAQLSEEIEILKEEGGISGGTTATASGKLLTLDCDEGAEIKVSGETTEAVTLVHCGKNLLPKMPSAVTQAGITITPNLDGSITLNGTRTGTDDVWPDILPKETPMYLPAGTYTFSAKNATDETPVTVVNSAKTWSLSIGKTYPKKSITIAENDYIFAFVTIRKGASFDNLVVYPQLEVGENATPYEAHKKEVYTNTLPISLAAYEGANNIYTESGEELTATVQKSAEAIINDVVAKQLAVDWSAYGLPMLYLTGDTMGMTKENAVNLAYKYGDMSGTASVKWQGASSLSYSKKNYTIKFDTEFEAKEGWGEQKKYCFKANFIDHTHARNLTCANIWGQLVKSRERYSTIIPNSSGGQFRNWYTYSDGVYTAPYGVSSGGNGRYCINGFTVPGGHFYNVIFDAFMPSGGSDRTVRASLFSTTGNATYQLTVAAEETWEELGIVVDATSLTGDCYVSIQAQNVENFKFRNVRLLNKTTNETIWIPTLIWQIKDLPNGGAVDGFPCVIMLNGEFLGLYTWNIPKEGWMLGMGRGTQECILCANGSAQPAADGFNALETTLGTAFDVEYITDEDNTDWALTSLNRMLSAVIGSDGSDLDTTVAQYLDWDSVIDHYIQTVLTGAADCTYKNYLLSTGDGKKWFFTGYDMDSTFGLFWDGKSFTLANAHPTFASYAAVHKAMDLVKKYKKDALKARYAALRNGPLSEISITNMLTNYMAGIPSQVLDEDARKWPGIPSTSASNLAQMLNWYRLRVAVADAEIEAL